MPCLLSSVHRLREVGLRRAAGAAFPVCFRTADSDRDLAVSTTLHSLCHIAHAVFLSIPLNPVLCSTASPASALSEPSCDIISKAQKLQDEAERSWALSQACAYYQHRCPPGEQEKESCIRIMGESCSARVLQCSLLSTMQNLEPATQTHAQGEETCVHREILTRYCRSLCV